MRQFLPSPRRAPERSPPRFPFKAIPSWIEKPDQYMNFLFHNGTGDTLYDFSGNDNHGTINGPSWISGKWGWGLSYVDAEEDWCEIPNLPTLSEYTIMVWSMHRSVGDGVEDVDIALYYNNRVRMLDEGDSTLHAYHYDTAWNEITEPISNDVMNLWALTYDGDRFALLKNDSVAGELTGIGVTSGVGDPDRLGRARQYLRYLDGIQADVKIFTAAIPDSEIFDYYERTRAIFK